MPIPIEQTFQHRHEHDSAFRVFVRRALSPFPARSQRLLLAPLIRAPVEPGESKTREFLETRDDKLPTNTDERTCAGKKTLYLHEK